MSAGKWVLMVTIVAGLLCRALSFGASSPRKRNRRPMLNSTDGNKVSISVRQAPRASDDRTAARIAAVVSKTKKDSLVKFMAAKSAVDAAPAGAPRRGVPQARLEMREMWR